MKSFSKISLLVLTLIAFLVGEVSAHATLVFATLTTEPSIAQVGEAFRIRVQMTDPTQVPIEDAVVIAEFSHPDAAGPVVVEMTETSQAGFYEGDVSLDLSGDYSLLLRDQTFRQEEALAGPLELTLDGANPLFVEGDNTVVFPPTATTSPNSLRTWLIWVIALPVVAGMVVTVLVLKNANNEDSTTEISSVKK